MTYLGSLGSEDQQGGSAGHGGEGQQRLTAGQGAGSAVFGGILWTILVGGCCLDSCVADCRIIMTLLGGDTRTGGEVKNDPQQSSTNILNFWG